MSNKSHESGFRIEQDGAEVVLWHNDAFTGERVERRFWAPPTGGYVREVTKQRPGVLGKQVCGGLYYYGPTLSVSHPDDLIALIRREWQKARRAEASLLSAT